MGFINGESIDFFELPQSEKREKLLSWQALGLSYTASGYGKRIPTSLMIRHNKRWHRVYCCIFSNSGTCYIETKRGLVIVR